MSKILVESNEFENAFCKVGNLQSMLSLLSDKIDTIHTTKLDTDKCAALNACFGMEDYAKHIYKELSELHDNALDYEIKDGAIDPVAQVVIKNIASFDLIEKLNIAVMETAANLGQEFPQAVLGLAAIKNLCAKIRAACEDGVDNIKKVQPVEKIKNERGGGKWAGLQKKCGVAVCAKRLIVLNR